jgi:hypothetical protein
MIPSLHQDIVEQGENQLHGGILYYGEILGKRTKWEEFIMLNLKFYPLSNKNDF